MELLQLEYFRTVARLEHMTKAAKELQIAQPSLSKTIARLEEDLGVPLFDRQNRHIRLNAYGKLFLARVNNVFNELQEGKREVLALTEHVQNTIVLAVSIPRVLPDLLGSFLQLHPNARFQQFLEGASSMEHLLTQAEIDFCISSVPMIGEDVIWEPLITEEIFLIVPPGHHLAKRERIRLDEVRNERFVSMNTGYGFRNLTDSFCSQAGFTPQIAFEGDEPGVIRDLVQQGLGVAFVPGISWVRDESSFPNRIRITHPTCQRTIGIGWSKRRYLSPVATEFRSFVTDYFAKVALRLQQLSKKSPH
ncbi:LysR family transcriptional regulator [Ectobacillus sp. JY-23]|uniref:LysR family transcriptional regulator n=1 Tax=Ectobacillus sp. JY-23 TaxID=2933872 RepID=UPI001FF6CEC6|nr:LysR family transcriptional regulator [Ectobacillus sp. JY-23]UOY92365.1 LysR family transcriptional regulator [Ectobacillus sp. JY-23]